jgi:hypothetical protein
VVPPTALATWLRTKLVRQAVGLIGHVRSGTLGSCWVGL